MHAPPRSTSFPACEPHMPSRNQRVCDLIIEEEHGVESLSVICRISALEINSIEQNPKYADNPLYMAMEQIVAQAMSATQYQSLRRKRRNVRQYYSSQHE
uniref:Uncharacterized protein n=1 Tax=Medicago truncatula TaxID=3880 RepID=A2Q2U8_MEDTR|nr:hypothetical protein MtrDRAFT_AC152184g34v2 [Medicago truncatula]